VPAGDVTPCELFKNKEDIAEVVKIREFEERATVRAVQIATDTARRHWKQMHGYNPEYPSTEEELLWIINYAGEAMHSLANEILGTDEPYTTIGVK